MSRSRCSIRPGRRRLTVRAVLAAITLLGALSCDGGVGRIAALPTDSNDCITQFCTLPDGDIVFDSDRSGTREIWSSRGDGSSPRKITDDLAYESWSPRLAPDRRRILFLRRPHGSPEEYTRASLWVVNADGTGLALLRAVGRDGWTMQGHPEWSPDGRRIAMFGGVGGGAQIFLVATDGSVVRQVTNRPGINTDVSWSPDGLTLAFNGCPSVPCTPANYEIYVIPAAGGAEARMTTNTVPDYDPYFSPSGGELAWLQKTSDSGNGSLGTWAIKAMLTTGTGERTVIDDGQVNSRPAWSLLADWIYFHRMEPSVAVRWRLFRIRPDGTGLVELPSTGNSEYPDPGK